MNRDVVLGPQAQNPQGGEAHLVNILMENDGFFRGLVDALTCGIAWVDLEGVVRYTNPAYNQILGFEADELVNAVVWQTIIEDNKSSGSNFYKSLLLELPASFSSIMHCRKKNGDTIDVLFNWICDRDETGRVRGFIALITDVTARLKTKSELRDAAAAADRANREKSRFLAAASHDLQQPLHSLSILLGLLELPSPPEKQQKIVTTMGLALDGAMALLRSVLDMSKLEAGVIIPRFENFDLESSFDQIEAELAPQLAGKPVEFRLVRTSVAVYSDRMLLKSILHNLVSNAIRYTSSGTILVGCRRRGGKIKIEVRDTGRGIPLEKQIEIFEEFKRLEAPDDDRQVYALGLGLSIVDRTCKLLGYKIKLNSRLGEGSSFSFEVPLAAPDKKLPLQEKEPHVRLDFNLLSGRKILLIEDDLSTLVHTNMLLVSWGCECVPAGSPGQALQEATRQKPDIILADYNLGPEVTGIMAARKIRAICKADIPVIIITSDTRPEVVAEVEEYGFSMLEKPASPSRLRALMTHYLQTGEDLLP
jgi:PAS domain S-box-containing protein